MILSFRSLKRLLLKDHLGAIVLMLIITTALWIFIELAEEVREGENLSLDETILLSLRVPGDTADPIGPLWVEEAARDITAMGSMIILLLLVVCIMIFYWLSGRYRSAAVLVFASITGLVISTLLKEFFNRQRPDLVAHQMETMTMSFPSGHSLLSALIYLTAGTLLAHTQPRRRLKAYFIATAITITVLVGISRLYLGVHWPSDVLAGWCVGSAWAIACWMVARRFIPGSAHGQEER